MLKRLFGARGFPVFFLNSGFPNYCLGSSEDKSLNKDNMWSSKKSTLVNTMYQHSVPHANLWGNEFRS